jgi:hypothetical protein
MTNRPTPSPNDVLRRMLNTPPKHKPAKKKPKQIDWPKKAAK